MNETVIKCWFGVYEKYYENLELVENKSERNERAIKLLICDMYKYWKGD